MCNCSLHPGIERAVLAALAALLLAPASGKRAQNPSRAILLHPDAPEWSARAPELFRVRLETSKGPIVIDVHRGWAPHGADRFYNLVRNGYYDDTRFFRVVKGAWAQFGISGDPAIAAVWRNRTLPDDPRRVSNTPGRLAYAFAVANGRSTQVFINLRDNSARLDPEGFAPFGQVVDGRKAALALNSEYGEASGGGIRAGRQGPLYTEGNAYLDREFPRLDRIVRARIVIGRPAAGTASPESPENQRPGFAHPN